MEFIHYDKRAIHIEYDHFNSGDHGRRGRNIQLIFFKIISRIDIYENFLAEIPPGESVTLTGDKSVS